MEFSNKMLKVVTASKSQKFTSFVKLREDISTYLPLVNGGHILDGVLVYDGVTFDETNAFATETTMVIKCQEKAYRLGNLGIKQLKPSIFVANYFACPEGELGYRPYELEGIIVPGRLNLMYAKKYVVGKTDSQPNREDFYIQIFEPTPTQRLKFRNMDEQIARAKRAFERDCYSMEVNDFCKSMRHSLETMIKEDEQAYNDVQEDEGYFDEDDFDEDDLGENQE